MTQLPGGRLAEIWGGKWLYGIGKKKKLFLKIKFFWNLFYNLTILYKFHRNLTFMLFNIVSSVDFYFTKCFLSMIMCSGILVTAIFTMLTPLAAKTSVPLLTAVRVLEGLGEGVTYPAMHAMLGKL